MQTEKPNVHEQSARLAKAAALQREIDAALGNVFVNVDPLSGFAGKMVAAFGEKEWTEFARRAGVHPPSDATKAVVLDLYVRRAQAAAEASQLQELADDLEETDLGDEAARAAADLRREHDLALHSEGADR